MCLFSVQYKKVQSMYVWQIIIVQLINVDEIAVSSVVFRSVWLLEWFEKVGVWHNKLYANLLFLMNT